MSSYTLSRKSWNLIIFYLVCALIFSVLFAFQGNRPGLALFGRWASPSRDTEQEVFSTSMTRSPIPSTSVFNVTRDARNYGLTSEQCVLSFSPLFADIDRAREVRQTIGNVSAADLDISWTKKGLVRAMIYDRQLFVIQTNELDLQYARTRALAILSAINRAITSANPSDNIPNIEFSFSVSDVSDPNNQGHVVWALSRRPSEQEKWLLSDFGFWSWPLDLVGSYDQIRTEIRTAEPRWEDKIDKAVWRGAAKVNKLRKQLVQIATDKDWADVKAVVWNKGDRLSKGTASLALSMPEHCRYRFLIQTEGKSYSGRGKYLQNCESVVIMHKRQWIEPHHAVLISEGDDQNFVEVARNFGDLDAKMKELRADPVRTKQIVANSVRVFRDHYLTPAAQACYWRYLFNAWASVSFEPEGWQEVDGRRRMRGVPFESFVLLAPST